MVGILRDHNGRVLINQRPSGKIQAGRWEFPGGKLEPRESPESGLRRELHEELGVVAGPMRKLIQVRHDYAAFSVLLDVREIAHFGGEPQSREGQRMKWVFPEDLPAEDILEADQPVVQALRLPDRCLVTPDPGIGSIDRFLDDLDASLKDGVRLVQLRAKSLSMDDYVLLAQKALQLCRRHDARLLLNGNPELLKQIDADGVHLDGARLRELHSRPVSRKRWLSAACHSIDQLRKAEQLDADFVLLGPVSATLTHPHDAALGWAGFRALAEAAPMPVFTLGGMTPEDIDRAREAGAQGIAAIRSLWRGS